MMQSHVITKQNYKNPDGRSLCGQDRFLETYIIHEVHHNLFTWKIKISCYCLMSPVIKIAVFHFLALNRCKTETSVTPFVSYQRQFFIVTEYK